MINESPKVNLLQYQNESSEEKDVQPKPSKYADWDKLTKSEFVGEREHREEKKHVPQDLL